jgi:preprotein translocase subunit YajC
MKKYFYNAVILLNVLAAGAWAQAAAPAAKKGSDPTMIYMMIVMFVIIYFLMIRPKQKKQKEMQNMLKNVKKGDKIITIGGIVGTVGGVKEGEDTIMVKVAENTVVELKKSAIASVINPQAEKAEVKTDKK